MGIGSGTERIGRDGAARPGDVIEATGIDRRRPRVLPPCFGERSEHRVRPAVALGHGSGVDRVRRTDATELTTSGPERLGDGSITTTSVGCEVAADVDLAGVELVGKGADHLDRTTGSQHQTRSTSGTDRAVERVERVVEERPPRSAGFREGWIDDEHGDDLPAVRRGRHQRRVVTETEVPPEPDDRRPINHSSGRAEGRQESLAMASPGDTVPGATTMAQIPRRRRSLRELIQRAASMPNRAENLAQPVCGFVVTSMTAVPTAQAGPGGQVVGGEIEVDDQLIAGQLPPLAIGARRRRRNARLTT